MGTWSLRVVVRVRGVRNRKNLDEGPGLFDLSAVPFGTLLVQLLTKLEVNHFGNALGLDVGAPSRVRRLLIARQLLSSSAGHT